MTGQAGYSGGQDTTSPLSDFNAHSFLIRQLLGQVHTITLVQVKAVTNDGGVEPVGYVDVQPLVQQVDGNGNVMQQPMVNHVPYFRLQGGANAIILDPQVGDIGICGFASRDISAVKASKAESPPGSRRRFDMADGLYIGGVLNGAPTQYVQFSGDGITLTGTAITINGPTTINGQTTINGNTATTGTLTNNGKDVGSTHKHGGVQSGSDDTDVPV